LAGRILVADDNQDTVELLTFLLSASGWQVSGANTVAEAKARIDAESFDLIILDSWMPDGDGVEFCRELRTSRPQLAILFLSGAAFPADISGATEAGCSAYLVKPCKVEELTRVVDGLIGLGSHRHQVSH